MREVEPKALHAPAKEVLLKVGIVLKEDAKTTISVEAPNAHYQFSVGERKFALLPQAKYQISVQDNCIEVSSGRQRQLITAPKVMRIDNLAPGHLAPHAGLLVEAIVAGRTFHWKKEINQTLPGSFEIHLIDNLLVLVNEVKFEEYIACVVASEMNANCPAEFAKAQAVAARSWAHVFLGHKHSGAPYTICNDDDCQRYQGTTHCSAETIKAVLSCKGKFLLTFDKHVCPAYYSKSCGGHTEDPSEIFGFKVNGLSALKDVDPKTPSKPFCSPAFVKESDLKRYLGAVDEHGHYYQWTYSLTQAVLVENLKTKFGLENLTEVLSLTPERRSKGKRVTRLRVIYRDNKDAHAEFILPDQYDIRRALHPSFLLSSAFEVKIHREKSGKISTIDLTGGGWGHGIGLCQIGALGMALSGHSYSQILKHYFPSCDLISAY